MVSGRSLEVLKVIVQDYIASREPVASKSIVDRHTFGVSAATIRNDMALLEEEELIAAPHTSSGRVPTDKGYRVFVDHLAEARPLTPAQRNAIESFLGESPDLDDVLARTVRLLAHLTNQVALAQYPSLSASKIRHIELVPLAHARVLVVLITDSGRVEQNVVALPREVDDETLADVRARVNTAIVGLPLAGVPHAIRDVHDQLRSPHTEALAPVIGTLIDHVTSIRGDRLVMSGAANLVRTGDDFSGNIFSLLETIEEQVVLLRLLGEMEADDTGVSVSIGRENEPFGLSETSVLASDYTSSDGSVARLGLLGPTRMDYFTNIAALRAVARYLSRLLGDER